MHLSDDLARTAFDFQLQADFLFAEVEVNPAVTVTKGELAEEFELSS